MRKRGKIKPTLIYKSKTKKKESLYPKEMNIYRKSKKKSIKKSTDKKNSEEKEKQKMETRNEKKKENK